jgi:hypothetical protein
MEQFNWAANNLRVDDPHELQTRGVNVDFAPQIEGEKKVVHLSDGRFEYFWDEERRPRQGYYADFGSLERHCRNKGLRLEETEAYVSSLPSGG